MYKEILPVYLPSPSKTVATAWNNDFKVLFLDIDETLIHCIDENDPPTMHG
jgi:CTD small phosphatase-like protein 2